MDVATEIETVTPVPPKAIIPPPPLPVKPVKLHPKNFFEAATRRNSWSIVPADGTAYEALFEPGYWANISGRLRAGDLIEVNAEDGSYFALFYVLATADKAARVVELLRKAMQGDELPDVGAGFEVKWKGPILKYSVLRTADGINISRGHDTRASANEALADYLKTLAR